MHGDLWWRDGVIYQIYPRSFADGDNDGLGDLPGIIGKLDYLLELGIDALWLSPFYPTPDKDFGYDISDYKNVDPRFGSLADLDRLVEAAHARGMRIILDLVLNHTSDQHAWFRESRASRDNPKADWYLWSDRIPNNWQSVFGGRAWTFAPERGQYYYHMFLPEQPDVNWRNPDVRRELLDVVTFWLERGVDGFRLDVFNVYFKDDRYRSNPGRLAVKPFERQVHLYDHDQPEMLPLLKELRALLDRFPNSYAVGETFYSTPEKIVRYSGPHGLHAAFDFAFTHARFDPSALLHPIQDWERAYREHGLWPNYVLGNHDLPRMATRHALGEDDARLKVMMGLLLTLRGTPFLYYGEEIGQRDIHIRRSEILDPPGKRYWPFFKGRDGCRAPMQWDASVHAGFSAVKPWLPVNPDYAARNVQSQRADPASLYNFTRRLLHLRKQTPALRHGEFDLLTPEPKNVMTYLRTIADEAVLIALNFSDQRAPLAIPADIAARQSDLLLGTHSPPRLDLAPYEVRLVKLQ